MKRITQNRIEIIKKAGDSIIKKVNKNQDKNEMENHFVIGNFLRNHPEKLLKTIIKFEKRWKSRSNTP